MRRRDLIVAPAAAALMGPFVKMYNARAEGPVRAKCLVIYYKMGGRVARLWEPKGGERDFVLSDTLSPLAELREYLTLIGGLGMWSAHEDPARASYGQIAIGHGATVQMLVGTRCVPGGSDGNVEIPKGAGAASVDQYIARRIRSSEPFESIVLNPLWNYGQTKRSQMYISWKDREQNVIPEYDPQAAFGRYVAGAVSPVDASANTALRARRKSILDRVLADYRATRERVGVDHRPVLEAHIDGVRELEKSLFPTEGALPAGACTQTEIGPALDYKKHANFHLLGRQHMDVGAMALACGRTRVLVLQMGDHNGDNVNFSWVGLNKGYHYQVQHTGDLAGHGAAEKALAAEYAYFLKKLKAIPSGSSNLLHESVVVRTHLLANAGAHNQYSMCYEMAGRAGGLLEGGRYIKYGAVGDGNGNQPIAHNDLLVSLCQLMGLRDVTTFGDAKYCNGGLKNLMRA